jgi:26S proteasome regulatory subunit T5
MFIGDGAKLVRDCFALAKEKAPAIIFIDELDAVGTKRFDSEKSGDREVQRTMLELLNQLDGFASDDRIKVLAATNRVDVLDPALLRSGRLDRKIEFPLPNEEARAQILKIHSRKMKVDPGVNWSELARSTDEFGGAMLKAVCVEAGMIALRMGKNKISHEHYVDAIAEVQAKKKDVSGPAGAPTILSTQLLIICTFRPSTSMHNCLQQVLGFLEDLLRLSGWEEKGQPHRLQSIDGIVRLLLSSYSAWANWQMRHPLAKAAHLFSGDRIRCKPSCCVAFGLFVACRESSYSF